MKVSISFDDALWVVVPREPDGNMQVAGHEGRESYGTWSKKSDLHPMTAAGYRAMLAAAPSPPCAQAEAVGGLPEDWRAILNEAMSSLRVWKDYSAANRLQGLAEALDALRLAPSAKAQAPDPRRSVLIPSADSPAAQLEPCAFSGPDAAPSAGRQSVEGECAAIEGLDDAAWSGAQAAYAAPMDIRRRGLYEFKQRIMAALTVLLAARASRGGA